MELVAPPTQMSHIAAARAELLLLQNSRLCIMFRLQSGVQSPAIFLDVTITVADTAEIWFLLLRKDLLAHLRCMPPFLAVIAEVYFLRLRSLLHVDED